MNFEKYMIAETPATEGFLGNLSRIPESEIRWNNEKRINSEIEALESYVDAIIDNLLDPYAMESTGSEDNLSKIATKAKVAGQKIKDGKKSKNKNLVDEGSRELSASMQELKQEKTKAKDPKTKARVWMVAKVVAGIVAAILLTFGAVKAGQALSAKAKAKSTVIPASTPSKDPPKQESESVKQLDNLINQTESMIGEVNKMRENIAQQKEEGRIYSKDQLPKGAIIRKSTTSSDSKLLTRDQLPEGAIIRDGKGETKPSSSTVKTTVVKKSDPKYDNLSDAQKREVDDLKKKIKGLEQQVEDYWGKQHNENAAGRVKLVDDSPERKKIDKVSSDREALSRQLFEKYGILYSGGLFNDRDSVFPSEKRARDDAMWKKISAEASAKREEAINDMFDKMKRRLGVH